MKPFKMYCSCPKSDPKTFVYVEKNKISADPNCPYCKGEGVVICKGVIGYPVPEE